MTLTINPGWLTYSQASTLIKVHCALPDDTLLLEEFSGDEAVSVPFRFTLKLISEEGDLELKQLMGGKISVVIKTASHMDRYWHGRVIQFTHIGSDGGMAHYEATMGSWLEFLRHRINCRIFQQMNVLEIIRGVFEEYKSVADFEIGAEGANYPPLTLCCQYRESDLDFVMRLMEEHGLYFYFRFEKDAHILVIEDDSILCAPMPEHPRIEYNTEFGAIRSDTIKTFSSSRQLVSNAFAAKTFNFKNSLDPMTAMENTNHQMGDLPRMEWYEYPGAYAFKDYEAGNRLVKLRIEEQELQSKSFQGTGNVRTMTCAHSFELMDHYNVGKSVQDRTFFVIHVAHHAVNDYLNKGAEPSSYSNSFECVRKVIPFRPGRRTVKPTMRGLQSAIVAGASGEEIHCDEYGRVLVQFHWDREGQFNAQSLCWVRVATQWAGSKFGFMSLPRVGTEVLVDFLEGDPDRPIIIGAVYNQSNMPPWELPTNKTQSGVLTRSTGGTYQNSNALRFEDKKGFEEVWLQAEKDLLVEVKNDDTKKVGGDQNTFVSGNRTSLFAGNDVSTTMGNSTTTFAGNQTQTTLGNSTSTFAGNQTVTTIGHTLTISASHEDKVDLTQKISAGDSVELECGASKLVLNKDGTITLKGSSISVEASGTAEVKGGTVSLSGAPSGYLPG